MSIYNFVGSSVIMHFVQKILNKIKVNYDEIDIQSSFIKKGNKLIIINDANNDSFFKLNIFDGFESPKQIEVFANDLYDVLINNLGDVHNESYQQC